MSDKVTDDRIFQMHAEVCKSLSSPVRLKILNSLRGGEKSVETLREELGLNKANLSQHLAVLRQRKIVVTRRTGLNIYYKISNSKMIIRHHRGKCFLSSFGMAKNWSRALQD